MVKYGVEGAFQPPSAVHTVPYREGSNGAGPSGGVKQEVQQEVKREVVEEVRDADTLHGQALVGYRVKVWWEGDRCWFSGVVTAYGKSGKCRVQYDDGDVKHHRLDDSGEEQWEPLGPSAAGAGPSAAPADDAHADDAELLAEDADACGRSRRHDAPRRMGEHDRRTDLLPELQGDDPARERAWVQPRHVRATPTRTTLRTSTSASIAAASCLTASPTATSVLDVSMGRRAGGGRSSRTHGTGSTRSTSSE